jgi:2'-5' RNA ligase
MITQYTADISQWREWEKEYRFGVVLIIPPEPLLTQVNALRARYDPRSQATCDAHISLTVPLPRPINDSQWRELESIVSAIEPFPIQYGPLRHYLPHPGVCLTIEPQDKLNWLRVELERASVFSGAPERKYPFSAHMTIAEFITVEQTLSLMDELRTIAPTGSFICGSVVYAVPDSDFHFSERGRLTLAYSSSD